MDGLSFFGVSLGLYMEATKGCIATNQIPVMNRKRVRVPVAKIRKVLKCTAVLACITVITKYMLSDHKVKHKEVKQPTIPPTIHPDQRNIHIGLLKVHKAASSTLQNIIIRFGLQRNLTFVLPTKKSPPYYSHVISTNMTVSARDIEPPPRSSAGRVCQTSCKTFDILCHHVIYDKQAWGAVLPKDTFIIGSVREPTSHFRSVLKYFRPPYIDRIQSLNKVANFLQNPYKYELKVPYSITNNRMSFEFGVEETIILRHDLDAFNKYLNEVLDKNFDIVVVAELFDESLVVMKRKFNWSLCDIVYTRQNIYVSHDALLLDDDLIPLLKKHNELDYLLYAFFRRRIEKQIENERDKGFDQEVGTFRNMRAQIVGFCKSIIKQRSSLFVNATQWNIAFSWTKRDCDILLQDEISLTEMLRQRQYPSTTSQLTI